MTDQPYGLRTTVPQFAIFNLQWPICNLPSFLRVRHAPGLWIPPINRAAARAVCAGLCVDVRRVELQHRVLRCRRPGPGRPHRLHVPVTKEEGGVALVVLLRCADRQTARTVAARIAAERR